MTHHSTENLKTPTWFADCVKNINLSTHYDGDYTTTILENKIKADKEVVKRMVCDFINKAKSKGLKVKSNNIAFDFYDNCLMVWLEVDDKQKVVKYMEIENALNERFSATGFRISSTIVGDWTGLAPSNYTTWK